MASKKAQWILKAILILVPVSIHIAMYVALANHQPLMFYIKIMNKNICIPRNSPHSHLIMKRSLLGISYPASIEHMALSKLSILAHRSQFVKLGGESEGALWRLISNIVAPPLAIHFVVLSKREKKIMFSWRKVLFFINPGYMLSNAHWVFIGVFGHDF